MNTFFFICYPCRQIWSSQPGILMFFTYCIQAFHDLLKLFLIFQLVLFSEIKPCFTDQMSMFSKMKRCYSIYRKESFIWIMKDYDDEFSFASNHMREAPGKHHRFIEFSFLSSDKGNTERYRQWTLRKPEVRPPSLPTPTGCTRTSSLSGTKGADFNSKTTSRGCAEGRGPTTVRLCVLLEGKSGAMRDKGRTESALKDLTRKDCQRGDRAFSVEALRNPGWWPVWGADCCCRSSTSRSCAPPTSPPRPARDLSWSSVLNRFLRIRCSHLSEDDVTAVEPRGRHSR